MPDPASSDDGATPVDDLDDLLQYAKSRSDEPMDEQLLAAVHGKLFVADAEPPHRLGRYVITDRLGAGGMGVVYRALDPELSRDVAIKLLRPTTVRSPAASMRLRREARALAEVSHPNVVQVYDVGTEGGAIFVSMELVPGIDVQRWLESGTRPWREVVTLFVAAGRGLQAAHDRGLVHRDFKPSNVLVGEDGRPRVVDFGLVCAVDVEGTIPIDAADLGSDRNPSTLTETGIALGTPAYMAPEQHLGRGAGPRSDQYAFCVSLYEGLFGRRPFEGGTIDELIASKRSGARRPPPGHRVPDEVVEMVVRGLDPDPERRWPGMGALLDGLEHAAHPRRPTRWLLGGLALVAVGGPVAALWGLGRESTPDSPACPAAAERLTGTWDVERTKALRTTVHRSGLDYARDTGRRLESRLDDYAAQWGRAYDGVCAAMSAPSPDAGELDRKMVCLNARRDALASLVDVLIAGEGKSVPYAVEAVAKLPPIAECDAPHGEVPTEGSAHADAVHVVRALQQADALKNVARYDDALELAESALAQASAPDLSALRARALLVVGQLYKSKGDPERAKDLLSEAALLATSLERDEVAAQAAIELVDVHGAWRSRYDDALEWSRHAQASIERLGHDPVLEARRLTAVGTLQLALGHVDDALIAFETSLSLSRAALDPDDPALAVAQANVSDALVRAGRFDDGLVAAQQAVAAGERAYGQAHPQVGLMYSRLSNAWLRQGDYAQAAEHGRHALEILRNSLGAQHANVAGLMTNLAQIEQRRGRLDEAEGMFLRVLPLLADGPNEPVVLAALSNLVRDRGDYPAALVHATRSREAREVLYGPDDTRVAMGLMLEGLSLAQVGRDEDATAAFERARRIAVIKPLPAISAITLIAYQGRAHLYAGRSSEAAKDLEQALTEAEAIGMEPLDRAEVRFHLVQALWAQQRREEALEQLAVVEAELATRAEEAEFRRAPIRAWIEREGADFELAPSPG